MTRRLVRELGLLRPIRSADERTFDRYATQLVTDIEIHTLLPAANDSKRAVQTFEEVEDLVHWHGTRPLEAESTRNCKGSLTVLASLPPLDCGLCHALDKKHLYNATGIQTTRFAVAG